MSNLARILWGIVLVLLGIIWGLNALDLTSIDIFFDGWWTLFIIVPSAIGLFDRNNKSKIGNLIGVLIGVFLLLGAQDIVSFEIIWKLLLPFIIVMVGISLIFGGSHKNIPKISKLKEGEAEFIVATFSENAVTKKGENFKGANLESIFGSVVLDLKEAKLEKETVIKASAIFGGIEIVTPDDVEVKVSSVPIFGGISNTNKVKDAKKVIYVDAFCLFGGINIK